jgi:hypothetical protein
MRGAAFELVNAENVAERPEGVMSVLIIINQMIILLV